MTVYHGSYIEIQKPELSCGRFNLDFGQGFYVTTFKEQAEKWAARRAAYENNAAAIVNVYEFFDVNLNILRFDGYTKEWLDFVVGNRAKKIESNERSYDAIFGNIADDDVAVVVNEYMRLLAKNRVNHDVEKATLYQLSFSKPNNQYCISTQKGIHALYFIKSYRLE